MPRPKGPKLRAEDLVGLKYFSPLGELLDCLRDGAHGNRDYHFDHHVVLLLLLYFNPVLTSLRSLQQVTTFEKVQKKLGIPRMSLGAMSDSASKVFDPELLRDVVLELAERCRGVPQTRKLADIAAEVVAVDGSFMRCVPSMAWAIFRRQSELRGVRLHAHLDLKTSLPLDIEVTPANGGEKANLRARLREGVLYVVDRGYTDYSMFQEIHTMGSFFVARVKDNTSYDVMTSRPLTADDRVAGVLSDEEVVVGSSFTKGHLQTPVRLVRIRHEDKELWLLSNEMSVSAETIGTLYRCRWQVELFFRWFKCVLGCSHWTSRSESGVTIQVYAALIASLLISLWTGRRPTKRTYEVICFYFSGWATEADLMRHIGSLKPRD